MLQHAAPIDVEDGPGRINAARLIWIIENMDAEILRRQFEAGKVPHSELHKVVGDITPFLSAVDSGNIEKVEVFRQAGAIVDSPLMKNGEIIYPIYQSIRNHDTNMAKYLIEHTANLNRVDEFGNTYLMYACTLESAEIATTLINRGADVYIKNRDGWMALAVAVRYMNIDIIKLLLLKSQYTDEEIDSLINLAPDDDDDNIINLLKNRVRSGGKSKIHKTKTYRTSTRRNLKRS